MKKQNGKQGWLRIAKDLNRIAQYTGLLIGFIWSRMIHILEKVDAN